MIQEDRLSEFVEINRQVIICDIKPTYPVAVHQDGVTFIVGYEKTFTFLKLRPIIPFIDVK